MNSKIYTNKIGTFHVLNNDQWIGETLSRGKIWNEEVLNIIFKFLPKNKNVIDIGAHIGTHSIPYAKHIDNDRNVYSFEPQNIIYDLLLKNIEENNINNIVPHNCALGHLDDVTVCLTNRVTDGKSKNDKLVYNTDKLINYGGICLGSGGQEVNMKTLDSFDFQDISFLKVDVEGCERLVLYGARKLIKRCRPYILFENKKNITKDMSTIMDISYEAYNFDIFDYCKKLNYSGVKPINKDYLLIP